MLLKYVLSQERGFSLVELMVVVSIIGILAAIAIPNFQRFTAKAKQSEAKSNLSAMYAAERSFAAEWQSFFADFRNIGYDPVGNLRYRHGFAAAGVACPGGYQGAGIAAGGAAVNFNTSVVCTGVRCTEIITPIAPGALAGTTTTSDTFIAQARGDIDGDAQIDVWNINQNKQLTSGGDDVAL